MSTIHIDDPADPRIGAFRDIRERDLVRQDGFIAEGRTVLDQLLLSQDFEATALLVMDARLAGLRDRLDRLPENVPVYVADREVMSAIAGFPIHRGVLAHGRRRAGSGGRGTLIRRSAAAGKLVVGLVGLSDADNVGAIFRNARAFGVGAVLLDAASCSPLYRKAIRVSVGTTLTVPWHRGDDAGSLIASLQSEGYRIYGLSPSGNTDIGQIAAAARDRPAALLFGSEGPGLAADILGRIEPIRIAMAPGIDSLNVAAASAIALHSFFRSRGEP